MRRCEALDGRGGVLSYFLQDTLVEAKISVDTDMVYVFTPSIIHSEIDFVRLTSLTPFQLWASFTLELFFYGPSLLSD